MPRTPRGARTADYDYHLPQDRIAQRPAHRRDQSRLMVLHRDSGAIEHRRFHHIVNLIPSGDALVLNETRVLHARLVGHKPTGAPAEVLLLHPYQAAPRRPAEEGAGIGDDGLDRLWVALVRPGGKLKPGRVVDIAHDLRVEILDSTPDGGRIVRLDTPLSAEQAMRRYGHMPLPPYIQREADAADERRYQTVYARQRGSVAAPTAGLHLTPTLLDRLEQGGVHVVRTLLHVGVGTFRPVDAEDPAKHEMHEEWYQVSAEAAARLNAVREAGGHIWAVGTTVARTLETVADGDGRLRGASGWTALFIRPPYRFRAVERLITNFHLPRSTLLMLVSAFGGYDAVMAAYRTAVAEGYRFYSYGDAMALV